ncbi:MAG: nucleotide exchange factor GrpE [Clostridia bacterium]|nr:nucleotide exchange factor GrpE [Clostridia bacterium]
MSDENNVNKKELNNKNEAEENISEAEVIENVSNNENDKLKEELNEMADRYKRLLAEFENYKKRTQKDKEGIKDLLVSDIMTSILPVIDNLEKAAKTQTEDKAYQDGVKMVLKQLKDVLLYNGVKEIETVGKNFDPELHEAVSHVTDDKHGENIIIEEFRKGYKIGTRVIRHSMVIVAN